MIWKKSDWNSQWDPWQTSSEEKTWITAEILDLCDKRRELRKKRFELESSEKYKEVNNNIKRCMKKEREKNWIGEQCSQIEENLRKNNNKRVYQLMKDLTTVKQEKAATTTNNNYVFFSVPFLFWSTRPITWNKISGVGWPDFVRESVQDHSGKCLTEEREIHQYWTVPRQTLEVDHPVLCKEVEAAVQSLKKEKSYQGRTQGIKTQVKAWFTVQTHNT